MELHREKQSVDTVNKHKVKIIALEVFLLGGFFAITSEPVLIFILAGDFFIRSVNQNHLSPLAIVAGVLVKILAIENIPVDLPPSKFAARIGLLVTLLIIAFWYAELSIVSVGLAVILSLVSFIESSTGLRFVYSRVKSTDPRHPQSRR